MINKILKNKECSEKCENMSTSERIEHYLQMLVIATIFLMVFVSGILILQIPMLFR